MKKEMTDENIMSEEIVRLRSENQCLNQERNKAYQEAERCRRNLNFENALWAILVFVLFSIPLSAATYAVYMVMTTPKKATHCNIHNVRSCAKGDDVCNAFCIHPVFRLIGDVPYGEDIVYGDFKSFEECVDKARLIHCPVNVSEAEK